MAQRSSRIVLITGAASGIGAAIARLAAAGGDRVILADIDETGARAGAEQIGPANAAARRLDIRSTEQWENVLDWIWQEYGRLDVLINNAAVVHTGFARDVPVAAHRHTIDTNFCGPLIGMMAALPRMKAQGGGQLVTVCSMTGFLPFPGLASYAAAKHALRAFHHAVAIEESDGPVSFTIVHPTSTETPMLEKEAQDDSLTLAFAGEPMAAEEVARRILEAVGKRTVELFIPSERGKIVRRVGTSPRSLRQLVERNRAVGAEKLKARRAAVAGPSRPAGE